MPILNIFFDKINAERPRMLKTRKASITLNLKDPEESKTEIEDRKIILFPFEFNLNYEAEAKIILQGYLTFVEEKKRAEEILKNWKKEKELMKQVYNYTLAKCNLKALLIEDQLGLPLHIPMPRVK